MPARPRVQIVDANDNLIGHKLRSQIDPIRDIYRSSCVWIEDSQGQVLLARRQLTKDKDPGLWGSAAAGTVDEGESYETNAYKELEEEIGLTGIMLTEVTKIWEGEPRRHFIQVFVGQTDRSKDEFTLQEAEVEQVMWTSKSALQHDFSLHPGKYVPSMAQLLGLFLKT